MEFRQIRYAVAVAKERSFTKAAARLNISQSAVSEQVKLLEERIGFPLLTRTGSGVEVTERGRVFLHEAERVANEPMIMSEPSVGYGLVVMNMLNDLGIRPRIQAVVDKVETMKVMVQLGMGLALVPEGAAASEVELGLLESLRIAPAHQVTIYSYRPREGYNRHKESLHAEILGSLGA